MLSNELLRYATRLGFGELYFKLDHQQQFYAIVAIHSTERGPSLGGCRFVEYASLEEAIRDALCLARGMSYKAALANLPLGGGKTVVIRPQRIRNRSRYFRMLGRFIHSLNGRYIIAMDSGVTLRDMDNIALETPFVVTTSKYQGNPAPYTALGIIRGMEAAVKFKFNTNNLSGLHVAIQGVGQVGYHVAKYLQERGVRLTVSDTNKETLRQCLATLTVDVSSPQDIYASKCDVFAPCALGGVLNQTSIPQLKATIVAGAANNQLTCDNDGFLLQKKSILCAPDYVINAGGLMYACAEYHHCINQTKILQQINGIKSALLTIFEQAQAEKKSPFIVADAIAESRLTQAAQQPACVVECP